MLRTVLVMMLAGCGDNTIPSPDAPSIADQTPSWSCETFRDCAGVIETATTRVVASSEQGAELPLVDACETQACSGALACSAMCKPE